MLRLLIISVILGAMPLALASPTAPQTVPFDPIKKILDKAMRDPRVADALKKAHEEEKSLELDVQNQDEPVLADGATAPSGEAGQEATAEPTSAETQAETTSPTQPAETIPSPTPTTEPSPTPVAAAPVKKKKNQHEYQAPSLPKQTFVLDQQAPEVKKNEKIYNYLGGMLDVGFPDGIGLSFVFRPLPWLRLHAGGAYNFISGSIRGGATFIPFKGVASPSLTVEGGHEFSGDANWLLQTILNDDSFSEATLRHVSYDYVNGHLGMEFGSKNFSFFLHGGVTYLSGTLNDFQAGLDEMSGDDAGNVTAKDPHFYLVVPSAKLGAVYHFW